MAEENAGQEERRSSLSSHVVSNALFAALARFGSNKREPADVNPAQILDSLSQSMQNMAVQHVTMTAEMVTVSADRMVQVSGSRVSLASTAAPIDGISVDPESLVASITKALPVSSSVDDPVDQRRVDQSQFDTKSLVASITKALPVSSSVDDPVDQSQFDTKSLVASITKALPVSSSVASVSDRILVDPESIENLINPLTGAILDSVSDGVMKEVAKPITPNVVPIVSVDPLTGAIITSYEEAAPSIEDAIVPAIEDAHTIGFRDALPVLLHGMRASADEWKDSVIGHIGKIQTTMESKLDGKSIAEGARGALDGLRDYVQRSPLIAPVIFAVGTAAEFQHDMVRTAQIAGGLYSKGFDKASKATQTLFTSQAVTQDQASDIIHVFAGLNSVLNLTQGQYVSLGRRAAELVQVLDFSADEAAILVSRFVLLGLTERDIGELNEELYNTGRALGVSNESIKDAITNSVDFARSVGITSADATKELSVGVLRAAQHFEHQLGYQGSAAREHVQGIIKAMIDGTEDGQRVMAQLVRDFGYDQNRLLKTALEDPVKIIESRSRLIFDTLSAVLHENGRLSADRLQQITSGRATDFRRDIAIHRQQLIAVRGLTEEEADKQVAAFRDSLKEQRKMFGGNVVAMIADFNKVRTAVTTLPEIRTPDTVQNQWNAALEASNKNLVQIGTQLRDIGQGILIIFGSPLLKYFTKGLGYVVDYLQEMVATLQSWRTEDSWFSTLVDGVLALAGGAAIVWVTKKLFGVVGVVRSLYSAVVGLPVAAQAASKSIGFLSGRVLPALSSRLGLARAGAVSLATKGFGFITSTAGPALVGALATAKAGAVSLALKGFGFLTATFAPLLAATWAWTAALLANPVTWIVLGVVALGAALIYLEKRFGALTWVWEKLSAGVSYLWGGLKSLFDGKIIRTGVQLYIDNLLRLFEAVQSIFTGVFGFVRRLFTEPIQLLKDTVATALNLMPDWVINRFESLRSLRDSFSSNAAISSVSTPTAMPLPPNTEPLVSKLSTMEIRREVSNYAAERVEQTSDASQKQNNAMVTSLEKLVRQLSDDTESREKFRRVLQLMSHTGNKSLTGLAIANARGD